MVETARENQPKAKHAMRLPGPRGVLASAMLLLMLPPAAAGTFDVKGADVEKGETELAIQAAVQARFPENADRVRQSWEVGLSHGFTDRFKLGGKINLDQPLPELDDDGVPLSRRKALRPSTVGVEAQYVLMKAVEGQPFIPVVSWFTGVDAAVHRDETNAVTFGPVIGFGNDKLSLTLNPLFERTFGRNSEDGVTFVYAWQIKREITEGAALALEGYGAIPDIGHAPSIDFQEHRIGPNLIIDGPLLGLGGKGRGMKLGVKDAGKGGEADKGPKAELHMGVLFGMTEATPDLTGKLKLAITW